MINKSAGFSLIRLSVSMANKIFYFQLNLVVYFSEKCYIWHQLQWKHFSVNVINIYISQGSWVRYPVWPRTFVSPSAFSRRAVVSYWRKYVHEVLVNRLGGLSLPRKSVVRLTDRPDIILDVYRGRKTTIQQHLYITKYQADFYLNTCFIFFFI